MTSLGMFLYPTGEWIKRVYSLGTENTGEVMFMSVIASAITAGELFFAGEPFGTSNMVMLLVVITVFINTGYGIAKSCKIRRTYLALAKKTELPMEEKAKYMEVVYEHRFDPKRVQFVFFKCFALFGYLYFVTSLMNDGRGQHDNLWEDLFGFSVEVLTKAPVALFWYYEFKSIGENSEYLYGQKAKIFKIVEGIFEFKFSKFFGDGSKSD